MTRARQILILLSVVLLGLTPTAALEARGPAGEVFSLVICSDQGAETITLDANGNPVTPHHICLDCCLAIDLPPPAGGQLSDVMLVTPTAYLPATGIAARDAQVLRPYSRGPPVRI